MLKKMDYEEYSQIFELERNGKAEEAYQLLERLADQGHPLALMDLSMRYYSTDGFVYPIFPLEPDKKKSKELEQIAKKKCEELASVHDGEALRMLGYYYLGLWVLAEEKDLDLGEKYLLEAYEANCYFAANDLATFYQGSDIEKAKFYYKEAERHKCRVAADNWGQTRHNPIPRLHSIHRGLKARGNPDGASPPIQPARTTATRDIARQQPQHHLCIR